MRDVKSQLEATGYRMVSSKLGNQRGAHNAHAVALRQYVILKSHGLAAQGAHHVRSDAGIGVHAKEGACTDVLWSDGIQSKPVPVTPVDVAVVALIVRIGDQRWNRIRDQTHLRFAAMQ